jgi:hypothetical protein
MNVRKLLVFFSFVLICAAVLAKDAPRSFSLSTSRTFSPGESVKIQLLARNARVLPLCTSRTTALASGAASAICRKPFAQAGDWQWSAALGISSATTNIVVRRKRITSKVCRIGAKTG